MIDTKTAALVTGLAAVCVAGLAWSSRNASCEFERARLDAVLCGTQSPVVLETCASAHESRSAVARTAERARNADEDGVSARGAAKAGTEAWYHARFLAEEQGGLDVRARAVLAANGPDCEKVAVLRALCDTNSAHAPEILAEAIAELPDHSGTAGESVPRCALRLLAERARDDAHARAALMRLVWSDGAALPSNLRASAAASLAVTASGAEVLQIARRLELERDSLVHASALEALSRNRDPDAVAACRSLGVEIVVSAVEDG